jgi:peptide/nickel transport system substrate-binding protein
MRTARARRRRAQMTWAVHVSLAPTWFDPVETPGIGTPFMILYALPRCRCTPPHTGDASC